MKTKRETVQMTNVEVGGRLLRLRRDNHCSQGEFARRLGVSVGAYQGYERGEREVPSSLLLALHEELGVDPLWMLAGENRESIVSGANLPSATTTNDAPGAAGNGSPADQPLPYPGHEQRRLLSPTELILVREWYLVIFSYKPAVLRVADHAFGQKIAAWCAPESL